MRYFQEKKAKIGKISVFQGLAFPKDNIWIFWTKIAYFHQLQFGLLYSGPLSIWMTADKSTIVFDTVMGNCSFYNICLKLNCGSNDIGLSRIGHVELEIIGLQIRNLTRWRRALPPVRCTWGTIKSTGVSWSQLGTRPTFKLIFLLF